MKSTLVSDHRLIGASIGCGRKKTMHIMCGYGVDSGQTNPTPEEGIKVIRARISEHLGKFGRVPWIVGGDLNLEPRTFTLGNANAKADYIGWGHFEAGLVPSVSRISHIG
eukprot:5803473-Heterocapsa_arctica.AAC.1